MKKYLAVLNNALNEILTTFELTLIDVFESAMRVRGIKYECKDFHEYLIWTDDDTAEFLNETFDWMTVTKIES